MSKSSQQRLPLEVETAKAVESPRHLDAEARQHAVDPAQNVVLEASAGTGKTRVLVERYVNLLAAGVPPEHILVMTFTRKAAAEMRQRILARLRELRPAALRGSWWGEAIDREAIVVSTIDAFCLALIREFPLEADVDPGFEMADETEVPRLVDEALDRTLRLCRGLAGRDEELALMYAQLGERRLRRGLSALLERRLLAGEVLRRFVDEGSHQCDLGSACRAAADQVRAIVGGIPEGLDRFLEDGPLARVSFTMLGGDLRRLCRDEPLRFEGRAEQADLRDLLERLQAYFLTEAGEPRKPRFAGTGFTAADCRSTAAWREHRLRAAAIAPAIREALTAFGRDLNLILARAVWRLFQMARTEYQRTLDMHGVLDFPEVLGRALHLLKQLDEFSRSRYRLESRFRHVLVDEFQDTSRAQWELIALLVASWREGAGISTDVLLPSIFIVGDRKQSIYRFRDADPGLFEQAATFIDALRPGPRQRRTIVVSFRAKPALLAFVNDLFGAIDQSAGTAVGGLGTFRYRSSDRFPVDRTALAAVNDEPTLGLILSANATDSAALVAQTVDQLLEERVAVRDRITHEPRPIRPGDIAVLFRSRDSHREVERALARTSVPAYVYKGLGFFAADEIQDALAVLRYLADPTSEECAASFLRSRLVRLSDGAIARYAPRLADLLLSRKRDVLEPLDDEDRAVLAAAQDAVGRWLTWVDRISPAELLDRVLADAAYWAELSGPAYTQAHENLKKLRALIRRIQNRGYATLRRIAEHLDHLATGDESKAVLDTLDAVNLMTIHAAKGLEFPVVFLVDLGRGAGGPRPPIRVGESPDGLPTVAVGNLAGDVTEEQDGEREEMKRLLYVALTRARDRLYLAAAVDDEGLRLGRGSLAEILPASFLAFVKQAASTRAGGRDATTALWTPDREVAHRFILR